MQKNFLKIVVFAIFCSVFSDMFSANLVSRALDLARSIQSSSKVEVYSKLLPASSSLSWLNNQPWLGVTINEITYFIFGSVPLPDGWVSLPILQNTLKNVTQVEWNAGVYLAIVQNNNKVYLVALDNQNNLIASDVLPNVSSVTGNVTWSGSNITNTPSIPASQALGLTTGSTSNLLKNISLGASLLELISMMPTSVTYDMQNTALTEINIVIGSVDLIFISSPFSGQPPLSDLGFIPTGTTEFTLDVYGYGASGTFETLSDLQAAIKANTLVGFETQVYDAKGTLIGSSIQLSSDLVTSLKAAFKSGTMPASSLGVNSQAVSGSFSYPISLTLKNIANWESSYNVVYDMQNTALTELNIQINSGSNTTQLTFVSSPGATFPLISDLNFIPSETTEFTLDVYGYGASGTFETLSDLQAAIKANTLVGFETQVYDAKGTLIGSPIPLSSDLVTPLKTAFASSMPTFNLGVNSADVTSNMTGAFSYPISLTLKNISVTNFFVPEVTTSKEFISDYNLNQGAPSYPGVSTVTEIHFNVNGSNQNTPNDSAWAGAYAFISNPWSKLTYSGFNSLSADISAIASQINAAYTAGSVSFGLIAYDANNTFIPDLTKTTAKTMVLYVYDQNGNIIGSPVVFLASNAIGLSAAPTFTQNSFRGGFSGIDVGTLTYPVFVTFAN